MDKTIPPEKLALRRAADLLGGQAALAARLGFANRTGVWPWFNTSRRVPAEYCPRIEAATNGAVKCEELRPDVAWSVLRERGCHSGMEFLASTLSYSTPQPVQPQDEAAELQRKFIEATDALAKMADRIQALQRVRAVA